MPVSSSNSRVEYSSSRGKDTSSREGSSRSKEQYSSSRNVDSSSSSPGSRGGGEPGDSSNFFKNICLQLYF